MLRRLAQGATCVVLDTVVVDSSEGKGHNRIQ
jgi:hypothetical protein